MMHFIRELNMQYADENQACESPCGYSTLANMPDYKSFKFVDDTKVVKGLKESKRTCVPEFDRQKEDKVLNNAGGPRSSMFYEDTGHVEAEGYSGRKKIHIKKNVVDSFMPEMVGFFEDSSYHFFRDIFRDIEARCEEIRSVENSDLDRSSTCSVLASDVALEASTREELREEPEAVAVNDSSENVWPGDQLLSEFRNPEAVSMSHYPKIAEQVDHDCNKSEASDESDEGDSTSSTITNAQASTEDAYYQEILTTAIVSLPASGESPSWDQTSSDQRGHEIPDSLPEYHEPSLIEVLEPLPYCGSLSFHSSIGTSSSSSSFSFPMYFTSHFSAADLQIALRMARDAGENAKGRQEASAMALLLEKESALLQILSLAEELAKASSKTAIRTSNSSFASLGL